MVKQSERKKAFGSEDDEVKDVRRRQTEEVRKRTRAALDQIDWEIVDKHLHTDEARRKFGAIRREVTKCFYFSTERMVGYCEPEPLLSYYEELYPKPSSNYSKLGKWIQQKFLVKGGIPINRDVMKRYGPVPGFLMMFAAGILVGRSLMSETSPGDSAASPVV